MKWNDMVQKDFLKNKKHRIVVLIAIFVFLYKPPIVETVGNLFRSSYHVVRDFSSFQTNLQTPHSGEQVLPPAVQEMLTFIRAYHLKNYQISEEISTAENGLIYQRIIESAWPIKMDPKSKNRFIFVSERDSTFDCVEKERKKEIALVCCR